MMTGRGWTAYVMALALTASVLVPTAAVAQRVNFGNFAGGLLGGAIAGAMMSAARPVPVIVYRHRGTYAPRHYAVARRRPAVGSAPTTTVSAVNSGADPFATGKPAAATVPVSAKP